MNQGLPPVDLRFPAPFLISLLGCSHRSIVLFFLPPPHPSPRRSTDRTLNVTRESGSAGDLSVGHHFHKIPFSRSHYKPVIFHLNISLLLQRAVHSVPYSDSHYPSLWLWLVFKSQ
ncbi:hypothetical protein CSKR_203223 [Clonorchis sinensis]|uniref:Uncharacterized protein n=1 Tax=Clonorchis sinensis TaxID=79923 RepID=A0A8T1M9C9_CLOSI|nr:hypothetical protein CSKR_203223 [Clonorchis sinensis]